MYLDFSIGLIIFCFVLRIHIDLRVQEIDANGQLWTLLLLSWDFRRYLPALSLKYCSKCVMWAKHILMALYFNAYICDVI